jgi:hypothetical protein
MHIDKLDELLGKWAYSMDQGDSHKLGYPTRSLGMYGGGASTSTDDMFDVMIKSHVRALDAKIDSLPERQKNAVYSKWLGAKPEELQNYHYNLAMDNLLTMMSKVTDT